MKVMHAALWAFLMFAGQQDHTGPKVGSRVPAFSAVDRNGKQQTLQSVLGPKGGLLVFYRSADW